MPGRKERRQLELFITGLLRGLIPDDHVLVKIDQVSTLSGFLQRLPNYIVPTIAVLASLPKSPCA